MKSPSQPISISEKDLKGIVSSTLRRQHLIGGLPGAMALAPVAAFAIGDLIAKKMGSKENVVEGLLCDSGVDGNGMIRLQSPVEEARREGKELGSGLLGRAVYSSIGVRIVAESCQTCSQQPPFSEDGVGYVMRSNGGFVVGSPVVEQVRRRPLPWALPPLGRGQAGNVVKGA